MIPLTRFHHVVAGLAAVADREHRARSPSLSVVIESCGSVLELHLCRVNPMNSCHCPIARDIRNAA